MYWDRAGWEPVPHEQAISWLAQARGEATSKLVGDLAVRASRKPLAFWPHRQDGQPREAWLLELAIDPTAAGRLPLWKLLYRDIRLLVLLVELRNPQDTDYAVEAFAVDWSSGGLLLEINRRIGLELGGGDVLDRKDTDRCRDYLALFTALLASGAHTEESIRVPYIAVGLATPLHSDEAALPPPAAPGDGRRAIRLSRDPDEPPPSLLKDLLAATQFAVPARPQLRTWLNEAPTQGNAEDELGSASGLDRASHDWRARFDPADLLLPVPAPAPSSGAEEVPLTVPSPVDAVEETPWMSFPRIELLWQDVEVGTRMARYEVELLLDPRSGAVQMARDQLLDADAGSPEWRVMWLGAIQAHALVCFAPSARVDGQRLVSALKAREQAARQAYAEGPGYLPLPTMLVPPEPSTEELLAAEPVWTNVVIEGTFDLSSHSWTQPLPRFVEVWFAGDILLDAAVIAQHLRFSRCHMLKRITGAHLEVKGELKIDECVVHGEVTLAEGFGRRSLPSLDLRNCKVGGSLLLLLSEFMGIVNLSGARVEGSLLLKGLLQLPRQHDAHRVHWFMNETGIAEPIFAMLDLRHVKVKQALDLSPARRSIKQSLFVHPGGPRGTAIDPPTSEPCSRSWRRTQITGSLRLDHAHAAHVELQGVHVHTCGMAELQNGKVADTRVMSMGTCVIDYLVTPGTCALGLFVERWEDDASNGMRIAGFRFTARSMSASGASCRELLLQGAAIVRDALFDSLVCATLRADADHGYRLMVGGEMSVCAARIELVSLRGAAIGRFVAEDTRIASSVDCSPVAAIAGLEADAGNPDVLTPRVGVLFTCFGPTDAVDGPADTTALELRNVNVGGDLRLCSIQAHGHVKVSGNVDGMFSFWDSDALVRLAAALQSVAADVAMPGTGPARWCGGFELRWQSLATRLLGDLNIEGLRIGGRLNLSNLHVGTQERPGSIDASDVVVGGELRIRAWASDLGDGPPVALQTRCGALDLRMAAISGDCLLTGLRTLTRTGRAARPGAWPRFWQRLLGIEIPLTTSAAGGCVEARGLQVAGEVELYRSAERQAEIAGMLDLSFATIRSLVMSGELFQSPARDLLLDHAQVGRMKIHKPYPAYLSLTGAGVGDWDVDDNADLLEILDNSVPFDSGIYSQVEASLRRGGDERRADEVYRALSEREWDERVGKSTALRRPGAPSSSAPRLVRTLYTLGGWPGVYRNLGLPLLLVSTLLAIAHWMAPAKVWFELPLLVLSCLVVATVFQRFLVDGFQMFRRPEFSFRAGASALLLPAIVALALTVWHPSYVYLPALMFLPLLVYLSAMVVERRSPQYPRARVAGEDKPPARFSEVHVWTRVAKWTVRVMVRPLRGSALLGTRLLTGYLTNPRPMIAFILLSFVIGLSAFSERANFLAMPAREDASDPASAEQVPVGAWHPLTAVLFTLHYVVPLASLADTEELFGSKDFQALRDGPFPHRSQLATVASAGTFFRLLDGPDVAQPARLLFGTMPRLLLLRWGCRHASVAQDGGSTTLIACDALKPTDLARLLSAVNWVAWPLVLLGFAARLRQRKGLS